MGITYPQFISLFCSVKADEFQTKALLYKEGQKVWNSIKGDVQKVEDYFINLKTEKTSKQVQPVKNSLFRFMKSKTPVNANIPDQSSLNGPSASQVHVEKVTPIVGATDPETAPSTSTEAPSSSKNQQPRSTPAQDEVNKKILDDTEKISAYKASVASGICTNVTEARKSIKNLENSIAENIKKRNRLAIEAERKRVNREAKKRKVEDLMMKHPQLSGELKCLTTSDTIGRPTYEKNDELLNVLKEIAIIGSGADDRRSSEIIRSIRSLDDLTNELHKQGYSLKRSAVYLRLLPRRADSIHGKTHKTTVPVKLVKAQNNSRASNPDRWFAAMTMQHTEELAALLGEGVCISMGKDDKAHVPIGITAATKQAPLLMNLKYKVTLPDHDFVVATKHKLTPTVLGLRKIDNYPVGDRSCVKYSGPTYIQIKSLKHISSNAFVQAELVNEVLDKETSFTKIGDGDELLTKAVLILTADGHDGPRFPTTRAVMARIFLERDLDFIWCATNAAGLSAYHFVERRMAPLSHALSGVVLPHDSFGGHLNSSGETIDPELEKKNFKKAAEVLCEIWNNVTIDGHDVSASYRDPDQQVISVPEPSTAWLETHCRISKYSLQMSKCSDRECCSAPRSAIHELINGQFLPGPKLLSRDSSGKLSAESTEPVKYKTRYTNLSETLALSATLKPKGYELLEIPYDFYCPSVQQKIQAAGGNRYQCGTCFRLFTTLALASKHIKLVGHKVRMENPEDDAPSSVETEEIDGGAIVIDDLAAFIGTGDD